MTNKVVDIKTQVILRKQSSGLGVILLDGAGKSNVLTTSFMSELESVIDKVIVDEDITCAVIISDKANTFVTGADLHEILRFRDDESAYQMSKHGQAIFNKLDKLNKPVVVAINGPCLGGGLELALSCDYRVASGHESTNLGLPEVKLGLVPGLGGTQRLPRLIGLKAAVEMILSAEPISAQQAKDIGLIDEIVDSDNLLLTAEKKALQLANDRFDSSAHIHTIENASAAKDGGAEKRKTLLAMLERSVRIKTKGNYPAHTRVLEVIGKGLLEGIECGLEYEAKAFGELAAGDVARNLIPLFFAGEMARRSAVKQGADNAVVESVGIIGGGNMGAGIAQVVAMAGYEIWLQESDDKRKSEAVERIKNKILQTRGKSSAQIEHSERAASKVYPASINNQLSKADFIVEAVFEDLEVKTNLFQKLVSEVKSDCVLATNTSSLSITDIVQNVPDNERILGLHFFYPVEKMPLVEVISHPNTDLVAFNKAMHFVASLGKTPIAVKDGPGFLVNRLLTCYLPDAARLAEQGIPLNWIEESAIKFGMPMGPFALLDEIGLDVAFKVNLVLYESFGDRLNPPAVLYKMQSLKLLGKKSGYGFYDWSQSDTRPSFNAKLMENAGLVTSDQKPDEQTISSISKALILPMVDEAARCLEEKVVRKAREIDLAMVLGIGFPAFRGGPLHFADSLGIDVVVQELEATYKKLGLTRKVSGLLQSMALSGRKFFSSAQEKNCN